MLYSFERTFRRQPSGLVSVDWQNPLADGLAMLAAPTRHQDWVRGRALTPSSATVGPGPAGQAWRMSGGSGSVLVPHDAGLNLTAQFTIFALARSTEGSGAQYVLNKNFDGSSSVPMSLAIGGTTVQQGAAFYRAPDWRSSGIGGVDIRGDGRVHAVAGSMDAVANLSYWVDGVKRAETNATTFPTATSTDVYIGRYQADSVSFRGDIYLVGITARVWSKSEHEAFAANPWQLFEPRRIWVPVSSGSSPTVAVGPLVNRTRLTNSVLIAGITS